MDDQMAFARLSGDYNPLHIDKIAARRFIFGYPVVHGVHLFLWALDHWLEKQANSVNLINIEVQFLKSVFIEENVYYKVKSEQDNNLEIELLNDDDSITTKISIVPEKKDSFMKTLEFPDYIHPHFPEKLDPRILSDDLLETDSGILNLYLHSYSVNELFPNLSKYIDTLQIAVLLSITRLIGVHCPGLNSIFFELNLKTNLFSDCKALHYEVSGYDRRFKILTIKIKAPYTEGKIQAFIRPSPHDQDSYLTFKEMIVKNEFSGQNALVIGGSRGLGEVVVKLMCAGGAKVQFTYFNGKEEAQRIADDIKANGVETNFFHFDVLNPEPISNIFSQDNIPTHLFYFPTPFIFTGVKGKFSSERFRKFTDYYVTGFNNTLNQLKGLKIMHIFYPSTIAINELPINMMEYTIAKIAGETLCGFLEQRNRKMSIYRPRLPRMATDQTASLLPVNNLNPLPVMLNELRIFRSASLKS